MKIKMCYSLEKALLVALLWLHMADLMMLQPVAQSQQQQTLVNRSKPTISRNQQQPVILPSRPKFSTAHGSQQQYHQVSMCQVHESPMTRTKCHENQKLNHSETAIAEFRTRLEDSSKDLREMLASYWEEIRTLSLDLVLVAKNNTLSKLQQNSEELLSRQSYGYEFQTNRLFDSMKSYLDTHTQRELDHQQLLAASMYSTTTSSPKDPPKDINKEVADYFKHLFQIQAKRLLNARLALSSNGEVDWECLDRNLQTQNQVELLLGELSSPPESSLLLEQKMLTQSVKQSLEFAATLLRSLHLSKEMFQNLTEAKEWMTLSSCHEALARMTVCQECYPIPISDETPIPVQAIPPCENYCLNVVRGCMVDVYELDSFWNSHINALSKFSQNMIQMNNIENVMSNLDEKLVAFMTKLNQQYNSTTSAPSIYELQQQQQSTNSLSFKMVKLCSRPATTNTEAKLPATPADGSPRSAAQPRQAILLMPPTQSVERFVFGHFAYRARLHPEQSIFNRVDTLVHQLRKSRDFFTEWPQRLCQRIRRQEASFNYQTPQQGVRKPTVRSPVDSTLSETFIAPGTSTNCWNGRDYSGYNKPLVEFGKAVTTSHPEVSASHTTPVNTMILNLVDKLKGIGAQLTRKSVTTPHLSLYQTLGVDALNSMSARADRLRAPQPNAVHSPGEPNDELISPSVKPLALQSSGQKLPQELLDAVIQLSKSHEERDENPSNAADDHDYTGSESEDSESYPQEDEDDYIECQKEDCSDIVSSIKPDLPTLEFDPPQAIPAAPAQENTPTVLLIPNPPRPTTSIKYTIPSIIPFEGNDIYSSRYLQTALPDYTPSQSSGASDHLLQIGPLQVYALIAFTLLVTTLCLRPKAIRLLQG